MQLQCFLTFEFSKENVKVFNSPVLYFSWENESQNLKSSNLQYNIIFLLFPICLNGTKFKYFITANPSQFKCPIFQ